MNEATKVSRILIFADESANWKIAGLRQIDRLLLSLNAHAKINLPLKVTIAWQKGVQRELQPPAHSAQLRGIALSEVPPDTEPVRMFDVFLSTRLLVDRSSIGEILAAPQLRCPSTDTLMQCDRRIADQAAELPCDYVATREQISRLERKFLRGSGKTQDGFVSRHFNRPISRAVTRKLLQLPVTPFAWTVGILPLPIFGSYFCSRGGYADILSGTVLFQLYSVLDGCDGEIARAKFLESARGQRLDTLCDTAGTLLLMAGLGIGLGRSIAIYQFEALAVAALIVLNERALASINARDGDDVRQRSPSTIYTRHLQLWRHSGIRMLGDRVARFLLQLTKRDVAMLAFVILALIGWPAWILHLSGITAVITLTLAAVAAMRLP